MTHRRQSNSAGFTLVELIISVALVVVLIAGVNMVFKMTADTVGAGSANSAATRDGRAAQTVLYNDFTSAVIADAPFFTITSRRTAAFKNQQDRLSDADYDETQTDEAIVDLSIRTIDLDDADTDTDSNPEGDTTVLGEITPTSIYNTRNHRVDVVSFFARGLFRRQTGNDNVYVAPMSSTEAWIKYGHLRQPDATYAMNAHKEPGYRPDLPPTQDALNATTNPNNFYATQWILGRNVMLLRQPDTLYRIYDDSATPVQQRFVGRRYDATTTPGSTESLAPFTVNSQTTIGGSATYSMADPRVQWSRYDLAGETISTYKQWLSDYISDHPVGTNWWGEFDYRFQGNRYPLKPLTSESMARTVPAFLDGCTQFIVEYAGDFFAQDTAGNITGSFFNGAAGVDGQIDFIQQDPTAGSPRRIRWYGMPRNVDTSDDVTGPMILAGGSNENALIDVVPFRDVYLAAGMTPALPVPPAYYFERLVPDAKANYAALGAAGMDMDDDYVVAWGPDTTTMPTPKLIRITLTLEDPAGRMAEGQTFEYIIELP